MLKRAQALLVGYTCRFNIILVTREAGCIYPQSYLPFATYIYAKRYMYATARFKTCKCVPTSQMTYNKTKMVEQL